MSSGTTCILTLAFARGGGCQPSFFSWITRVKSGRWRRNFYLPCFTQFYTFHENFVTWTSMILVVVSFSRPCPARTAIQRQIRIGKDTVSLLNILKRQDDHISCQWWWYRRNLDHWPLFKVISGHIRSHALFAYNLIQKQDSVIRMVLLSSARHDGSIVMQIGAFSVTIWSYGHSSEVNTWPRPFVVKSTWFDASRWGKHDDLRNIAPALCF